MNDLVKEIIKKLKEESKQVPYSDRNSAFYRGYKRGLKVAVALVNQAKEQG